MMFKKLKNRYNLWKWRRSLPADFKIEGITVLASFILKNGGNIYLANDQLNIYFKDIIGFSDIHVFNPPPKTFMDLTFYITDRKAENKNLIKFALEHDHADVIVRYMNKETEQYVNLMATILGAKNESI